MSCAGLHLFRDVLANYGPSIRATLEQEIDPRVRKQACMALSCLDSATLVLYSPALIERLEDPKDRVRRATTEALCKLAPPELIKVGPKIAEYLNDDQGWTVECTLQVLRARPAFFGSS